MHKYSIRSTQHIAYALFTTTNGQLFHDAYIHPFVQNKSCTKYVLAAILFHQQENPNKGGQPIHKLINQFANAVIDNEMGEPLKYIDLIKHPKHKQVWLKSTANKLGNLAQCVGGRVKGTDTIQFVSRNQVPNGRKITYAWIVCLIHHKKTKNPYQTWITISRERLEYSGETAAPTADVTTSKVLFNSVVSTPNAKFVTFDIENFYLNTPLDVFEYLGMNISLIPQEIIDEYELLDKVDDNGFACIQVEKGMYGLKQSGILANKLLEKHLTAHGYYQSTLIPWLWCHWWRQILFVLVVNDFGIKYVRPEYTQHVVNVLEEHYIIAKDWTGSLFCGISLTWDYKNCTVQLSMPVYVAKSSHHFQHIVHKLHQDAPHKHQPIKYGTKVQPVHEDTSDTLPSDKIKWIQEVIGTLLYYVCAVDPTMLTVLSTQHTSKHPSSW